MFSSENWFGASAGFYNGVTTQSLRFDSGSSAYLTRTPSSAGNTRTFTFSAWFKKSKIYTSLASGQFNPILSSGDGVNDFGLLAFSGQANGSANDKVNQVLYYDYDAGADYSRELNRSFSDPSAWFHFVFAVDTTDATEANRVKYYINGVLQTAVESHHGAFPQNRETSYNRTDEHMIGKWYNQGGVPTFNGYMAEINFVDGTQYDASYFGETKNGVWIPKEPSVTYGTNGYRLQFKQTGTGTASSSTIGADTSGNNNHWTSSGIVASDCNMPDSPENNFSTLLGSLSESSDYQSYAKGTYSEGALKVTGSSGWTNGKNNFLVNSGKWYAEVRVNGWVASNYVRIGVFARPARTYDEYFWLGNGTAQIDSTSVSSRVGTFALGDILQIAIDLENNNIFFGKNNTWQNSATQAEIEAGTSTNAFASGSEVPTGDGHYYGIYGNPHSTSTNISFNFGQDSSFGGLETAQGNADGNGIGDFYYAPPSGFLALCTSNLSDDNIPISPAQTTQADDHFNTVLYTGDGSSNKVLTGFGFQPDWVWQKTRSASHDHFAMDSSRGANAYLKISLTSAEATATNFLKSFDSDGVTIGDDGVINGNGVTNVMWNWKAGGTTPTKTYKVVVVSDSGNKYRFRNSADDATFAQSAVTLDLQEGGTYRFDQSDSSNSGHPFRFSLTSNGTHGGGSEYTTGVTTNGTAGSAGAYTEITVASGVATLYYYCTQHSAMGGQINTNTTSGQTNFDGSILSISQANTTSGFGIVTYTGNATSGATVGHGLGVAPKFVIIKNRDTAGNWTVRTTALDGSSDYFQLNLTDAISNSSRSAPTSNVFSIGGGDVENKSGDDLVAYCFAEVDGYSKLGSYTGNGNADGAFVFIGFRPAWLMVKVTNISGENWHIFDSERATFNTVKARLIADGSTAENSNDFIVDFTSNGFKWRDANAGYNGSGNTYLYMAFAEAPFKYANAR
ncbi:SPRY domain containing [uncultured Mediterranean phage uvMED]|uniref:DUF7483 domain-containing protein n=1 Tax=uncultured organism MedDCM-OCT-S09-C94 TaxID=743654 RepID=D6PL69_9ZZZZ|nr:hypothetical protein [uncultured organism MedDCM-OCT-S09-C94]BAQ91615.1 SPRY domain containing [uncultured Mediterranean phage uvMED]BAQ91783.1 SPRY domain containing [uncultured Mediterranean phage uvMED]BAR20508.1 SPRY domain containing [uncultured Mediterranean phage uvMED]